MPPEIDHIDPTERVIRGLPWILLIVVLLAIFVFTAYAVTRNPATTQPGGNGGGGCVTIADGPTVQSASCGTPGARAVVAQVGLTQACPDQSERLQPATGPIAYCLEVGK
jgi:hypothetical protein